MQKYQSIITATNGSVIRNVPVTVLQEDGSLAEIFLDREGQVPAPNPLATDSRGVFYFYAKNGRYSLRASVDGITITDADAVLLNDPEELATAGPIAEAVAAAQAAAQQAQAAVDGSGIPELVAAAQNAVVDANNAVGQAQAAASLADTAKNESAAAKVAAENAQSGAQSAYAQAGQARVDAQTAAQAAAQSAASIDPAYLRNRANHTGAQAISTVTDLQDALDSKVDKVAGKQLSTEDFTSAEKVQLSGLQSALDSKADNSSVAQSIALAATFTAVPTTFQAPVIFVTQPHPRVMQWDGTKYVRSPLGTMPGVLFFSHAPSANIAHGIQVRADVTYNTADHPDLAAVLGVIGTTFVLPEGRARTLRAADLGAGIDTSLVNGYLQGDAGRNLTATFSLRKIDTSISLTSGVAGAYDQTETGQVGAGSVAQGAVSADLTAISLNASLQWPTASEFRVKSLTATLYITR